MQLKRTNFAKHNSFSAYKYGISPRLLLQIRYNLWLQTLLLMILGQTLPGEHYTLEQR